MKNKLNGVDDDDEGWLWPVADRGYYPTLTLASGMN